MNYRKLTGIILKKQNYKEADQIVTVYTKEIGKIRVLARGLRKAKSKLAYAMQDLSLVEMEIINNKFPTLISAKPVSQHKKIREDLSCAAACFYMAELVLRSTPDEQPNVELFELIGNFMGYMNSAGDKAGLESYAFALKLMSTLGYSIERAEESFTIPAAISDKIQQMRLASFETIDYTDVDHAAAGKLKESVRTFVEYVLERNLKSEPFLIQLSD